MPRFASSAESLEFRKRMRRSSVSAKAGARRLAVTVFAPFGTILSAQEAAPIRSLAPVEATSKQTFGLLYFVRPLADGRLLVNDGARRQLLALDSTLKTATMILDSVPRDGISYGTRPQPMMPYLGDSTLMVDITSNSLLLLDPFGKIVRTISVPHARDITLMGALGSGGAGADAMGRLVYRGPQAQISQPGDGVTRTVRRHDRAPVLRANLETRTIDTIGNIRIAGARTQTTALPRGGFRTTIALNPMATIDDWAVLSDGTIAMVRGQDYHIDWIRPDGSKFSTPKVDFPWKAITEAEKQALFAVAAEAMTRNAATTRAILSQSSNAAAPSPVQYVSVPISEYADYHPPIRTAGVKADLDANLWVLTSATTNAAPGESVYDVFNNRGELTQRVRVPKSKQIAGFGKGGVIYLMTLDIGGYELQRTKVAKP